MVNSNEVIVSVIKDKWKIDVLIVYVVVIVILYEDGLLFVKFNVCRNCVCEFKSVCIFVLWILVLIFGL